MGKGRPVSKDMEKRKNGRTHGPKAQVQNDGRKLNPCQHRDILAYIKTFGSIDNRAAAMVIGCQDLAGRIRDLRELGYNIITNKVPFKNRYNRLSYRGVYTLDKPLKDSQ